MLEKQVSFFIFKGHMPHLQVKSSIVYEVPHDFHVTGSHAAGATAELNRVNEPGLAHLQFKQLKIMPLYL